AHGRRARARGGRGGRSDPRRERGLPGGRRDRGGRPGRVLLPARLQAAPTGTGGARRGVTARRRAPRSRTPPRVTRCDRAQHRACPPGRAPPTVTIMLTDTALREAFSHFPQGM